MAEGGCTKVPLATAGLVALVCILLLWEPRGVTASSFCQQVVEPLGYGCREFTVQTDDGFLLVMHRLGQTPQTGDGIIDSGIITDKNVTGKTDLPQAPEIAPSSSTSTQTLPRDHTSPAGASLSSWSNNRRRSYSNKRKVPIKSMLIATANGRRQGPLDSTFSVQRPSIATGKSASVMHILSSPESGSAEVEPSPTAANDSQHHSNPADISDTVESPPSPIGSSASGQTPSIRTGESLHNTSTQQPPASASSASPRTSSTIANGTSQGLNYTPNPGAGKGAPVLLMHQEFLNGATWFQYQNISRLLPTMLFDDGFDVWIGHQRATYWGHDHVNLQYTDRAYWDWTWDEHAHYDLPAQLRFITAETNQTVHYIGVSQAATVGAAGATDFTTACMMRSLTLIGATAYRGNSNSLLLEAWAFYFGSALDSEYYATGFQNGAFNYSSEFPPGPIDLGNRAAGLAIGLISGPNCCLGSEALDFGNGWDGTTSFKNLLHWQQGIRRNTFAHYDYNNVRNNTAAYGRATAPFYNPATIPRRLPILVIAGGNDWTAPVRGTRILLARLQEPVELINLTNYAHYDLTYSTRRENDVYLPILRFLEGHHFL